MVGGAGGVRGCRGVGGGGGGLKMLVKKIKNIYIKKIWEPLQNSLPLNLSSQLIKLSTIVQLNAWIFYSKLENEEH